VTQGEAILKWEQLPSGAIDFADPGNLAELYCIAFGFFLGCGFDAKEAHELANQVHPDQP
jgi:hypothetical protein